MKSFVTAVMLTFAVSVAANTVEEARGLYAQRGANKDNALKASEIYKSLADGTTDKLQIAEYKTLQAQALYFYAGRTGSDSKEEKFHKIGFEAADVAVVLLSKEGTKFGATAKNSDLKTALATAHYFSAINMGKWAEARGILASLGQWGNMKKHLEAVVANDKTVESYGAHRTFGRAYMKLPFTHGGSKKKSEKYLKEAYEATFSEDFGTAENTTTTAYYLDILVARNKADTFCDVYYGMDELTQFSDEELEELNPGMVPEAKTDIKKFLSGDDYEEDVLDYAAEKC